MFEFRNSFYCCCFIFRLSLPLLMPKTLQKTFVVCAKLAMLRSHYHSTKAGKLNVKLFSYSEYKRRYNEKIWLFYYVYVKYNCKLWTHCDWASSWHLCSFRSTTNEKKIKEINKRRKKREEKTFETSTIRYNIKRWEEWTIFLNE